MSQPALDESEGLLDRDHGPGHPASGIDPTDLHLLDEGDPRHRVLSGLCGTGILHLDTDEEPVHADEQDRKSVV